MNYSTRDTEWATSAKGNTWRRINGVTLIVGQRKDGKWWARRGDEFVKGSFESKIQAKNAAELGLEGDDRSDNEDDEWLG
jgi:hypothetical protein